MEGDQYTSDVVTLGSLYQVQRMDGSWHMAEVIQKRENPETKCTEYYVHYKDCEYSVHVCVRVCVCVCVCMCVVCVYMCV